MQFAAFGALDQVLVPFARVDCPIERLRVECNSLTFAMEAFDLKFAEFHVEVVDKVFKYIARLGHKSRRLLIRQNFFDVLIRPFEIREKKYENFLWISGDFDEVDHVVDLMEIPVEHLSGHLYAVFVISDGHGRRPLLCNDVYFILPEVAAELRHRSALAFIIGSGSLHVRSVTVIVLPFTFFFVNVLGSELLVRPETSTCLRGWRRQLLLLEATEPGHSYRFSPTGVNGCLRQGLVRLIPRCELLRRRPHRSRCFNHFGLFVCFADAIRIRFLFPQFRDGRSGAGAAVGDLGERGRAHFSVGGISCGWQKALTVRCLSLFDVVRAFLTCRVAQAILVQLVKLSVRSVLLCNTVEC